jgi:hypothetical protein
MVLEAFLRRPASDRVECRDQSDQARQPKPEADRRSRLARRLLVQCGAHGWRFDCSLNGRRNVQPRHVRAARIVFEIVRERGNAGCFRRRPTPPSTRRLPVHGGFARVARARSSTRRAIAGAALPVARGAPGRAIDQRVR